MQDWSQVNSILYCIIGSFSFTQSNNMYLSRHVFLLTDMFVKRKRKPTDLIPLGVIVSDITHNCVI